MSSSTSGIGRLYGTPWGLLAAGLLFLTLPEEDAPRWSWLFVLAAEALLRVLPAGTAKRLFEGVRLAAVAIVAIIAVPFLVQHVREGLFPALASQGDQEVTSAVVDGLAAEALEKRDEGSMGGAAGAPAAPPTPPAQVMQNAPGAPAPIGSAAPSRGSVSKSAAALKEYDYRQSNSQVYDPNAMVQTGPGLPRWQWSTLALRWSGPVAASQRLHLYLLSPHVNLVLALVRSIRSWWSRSGG